MRISGCGFYTSYGEVEATAIQSQTGSPGTISQEGAIIAADGDVFFANRIDDAFAIVVAGAPGLEVSYENRPVGRTDASGKAIVPRLNAYQPNKTRSTVWGSYIWAGAGASGVQIDFAGGTGTQSATQTIYGRVFSGQQTVAAGSYLSAFSGTDAEINYGRPLRSAVARPYTRLRRRPLM